MYAVILVMRACYLNTCFDEKLHRSRRLLSEDCNIFRVFVHFVSFCTYDRSSGYSPHLSGLTVCSHQLQQSFNRGLLEQALFL